MLLQTMSVVHLPSNTPGHTNWKEQQAWEDHVPRLQLAADCLPQVFAQDQAHRKLLLSRAGLGRSSQLTVG